jgi:hypothetical protein
MKISAMKRLLVVLPLILCGIAAANPEQIRVSIQFVEVPHSTLTEMLSGPQTNGHSLHEKAVALSKEGHAKILETCMVVCRSGEKASVVSNREEIYPTEYAPPMLCGDLNRLASDPPISPALRQPTAFDTRNTGVTFEVEASKSSSHTISLILNPEIVTRLRLETWMEHLDQWGDGSMRMPIYETWKTNTSIDVEPGKFELVSALTPKAKAPVPAISRKILIFVRADVLPSRLGISGNLDP